MLLKTEGVVLGHVKYAETSIVVKIFTRELGLQGYVVNNVRSAKNKGNSILLQPLSLLDLEVYHHPKKDLHRIKEFKINTPLTSIPFEQTKRSIAFFLTEVLQKSLQNEESSEHLYRFVSEGVKVLDLHQKGENNFHLYFMFYLSRFIGFEPDLAGHQPGKWFDLLNGRYTSVEPAHRHCIKPTDTFLWQELSALKADNLKNDHLNTTNRNKILNWLIEYYQLHIPGFGHLKTLDVLHALF